MADAFGIDDKARVSPARSRRPQPVPPVAASPARGDKENGAARSSRRSARISGSSAPLLPLPRMSALLASPQALSRAEHSPSEPSAATLAGVLADKAVPLVLFADFLAAEFAAEIVHFYLQATAWKQLASSEDGSPGMLPRASALVLYDRFLGELSENPILVSPAASERVAASLLEFSAATVPCTIFDDVLADAYSRMDRDAFARFRAHPRFVAWCRDGREPAVDAASALLVTRSAKRPEPASVRTSQRKTQRRRS